MALIDSILAYWKFEGNSDDSVGVNNGTDVALLYSDVYGKVNRGAHFNGVDSAVTLGGPAFGLSGTISFWLKPDSLSAGYVYDTSLGHRFLIYNSNTDLGYLIFWLGNATVNGFDRAFPISVGVYQMVSITWSGSTIIIYKNGVQVGVYTRLLDITIPSVMWFGRRYTGWGFLDGDLDEFGIWSRVLSPVELLQIYNSGYGFTYPFLVVSTEAISDVVGYTAIASGIVLNVVGEFFDTRGFVFGTASLADPGDVAPAVSGYGSYTSETGSFGLGSFSDVLANLTVGVAYFVRSWVHNVNGYVYGNEVTFVANDIYRVPFTNLPGIAFKQNDTATIYAEQLNDMLARLHALDGG